MRLSFVKSLAWITSFDAFYTIEEIRGMNSSVLSTRTALSRRSRLFPMALNSQRNQQSDQDTLVPPQLPPQNLLPKTLIALTFCDPLLLVQTVPNPNSALWKIDTFLEKRNTYCIQHYMAMLALVIRAIKNTSHLLVFSWSWQNNDSQSCLCIATTLGTCKAS